MSITGRSLSNKMTEELQGLTLSMHFGKVLVLAAC